MIERIETGGRARGKSARVTRQAGGVAYTEAGPLPEATFRRFFARPKGRDVIRAAMAEVFGPWSPIGRGLRRMEREERRGG